MPQSLSGVTIHFVFGTKNRAPFITDTVAPELHAYIGGIIRAEKCVLLAVGGMADHVHLLISMSREISLAELVRVIKSGSSKWMHEKGHREFAWQTGYAAFSVSQSNVESVRSYIARQAQHHRQMSFREEYLLPPRWGLMQVWAGLPGVSPLAILGRPDGARRVASFDVPVAPGRV